ncbi:hypothetical protein ZIOFF_071919 [Zingiber officinale]|uniref:Eukaryotic translation initiation factor 3 subunit E N-terminal domain-containing protein n=1 Tax=Zingiber officinale TaxID=94328 RepID=A0A8J5CC73_ZINOF|nr:hypothetical protein ZIOFF_071919 [Zingiber officinale]
MRSLASPGDLSEEGVSGEADEEVELLREGEAPVGEARSNREALEELEREGDQSTAFPGLGSATAFSELGSATASPCKIDRCRLYASSLSSRSPSFCKSRSCTILKDKIQLLSHTNMVDYAMNIHKALYHTEDVPKVLFAPVVYSRFLFCSSCGVWFAGFAAMVDRRAEVVSTLKSLEESVAPLISFRQDANLVQELRPDRQYNIQMLHDSFQIGTDQIEAFYQYAKFQFECGKYSGAADYLYQYHALCTNSERNLSALWGKLAAEILMQNWDVALQELNRLKEIIDSKSFSSPLNQLQNRIWLMPFHLL